MSRGALSKRAVVWVAALLSITVAQPVGAQKRSGESGDAESSGQSSPEDDDSLFEKPDQQLEIDRREGPGQRRVRRVREAPLEQMSRDDAQAAGFVFGNRQEESSRTSAAFLAATAGALAHGVGHLYLEDRRTASILLVGEGVSVALMASALIWEWASEGSPASRAYAGPALYGGLGLFGLTYLLDVIGTVQDADIGLPQNSRRVRGASLGAEYQYLSLEGFGSETLQLLTAGSTVDFGGFYVGARTDQDVSLDTSVYAASLGARPWHGPGRHTFAYVEADAELFSFSGAGSFRRLGGAVRAGVSLGLGNWVSQLRHVAVGVEAGYGHYWYALPEGGTDTLTSAMSTGFVPFGMFIHLNLTERLNTKLAYKHREGGLVETAPVGLAVASLEFLYRSTEILDLVVAVQAGGGIAVTGGLKAWVWQ